MTDAALPHLRQQGPALRLTLAGLANGLVAIFVFCGAIAFVEPSPYDVMFLLAAPVWALGGFRIHRVHAALFVLLALYTVSGYIALVPHWMEPLPATFMLQSLYLVMTAMFFALFVTRDTIHRTDLVLKAFTAGVMLASGAALAGYLDIAGTSALFMVYDRAAGTFKDPNVLGSFAILGVIYPMQLLLLGRTRRVALTFAAMMLNTAGVFLTFSRGSWGATIFAAGFMTIAGFLTTRQAATRRRIVVSMICLTALVVAVGAIVLSIESIREFVMQRMQGVGAEYEDPRFRYQMQSLSMLLERPLGFGPLRYYLYFDLDPHSSYVNAFASYGWLGGLAFILLVGSTLAVGLRLSFTDSPFRLLAQCEFGTLFALLLQGFQIDLDHWRHVHLLIGLVWGLEAARQRWEHYRETAASA